MSNSVESRDDGSMALFINDDLQFDSKDEHIYHEGLVLPALALITKRTKEDLHILIIGGGDGLVARELFKSEQIKHIDLVDYDPDILDHAKQTFADLNKNSLADPRLSIHIEDAWQFVARAKDAGQTYDLIISDLTVPDDAISARFHSINWYQSLSTLLNSNGLLAINGVSALATPEAFWCVYNSIAKTSLKICPYHVNIPSFTAKGFGEDWVFYLASNKTITADEIASLDLAQPRLFLRDSSHLLELFEFPEAIYSLQSSSQPALAGSDILIHYFNITAGCPSSNGNKSSLSFEADPALIPQADDGTNVLPPSLSSALAQINLQGTIQSEELLQDVLTLMPALQNQCSPELIEEFVQNPSSFIEGIDLPGLVSKLLQRAKELPAALVTELELLRDKLQDWAGDHLSLFALGQRVMTVLTIVIVIGNVLYPDSVYGKGEHHAGPTSAGHHGGNEGREGRRGARGRRGVGGVGGGYGYANPNWNNGINPNPVYRTPANIRQPAPGPARIQNITRPGGRPGGATTGFLPDTENPVSQPSYLAIVERNVEATKNRLLQKREELLTQKFAIADELQQYQTSSETLVDFGLHKIEKQEAIRRTEVALQKTQNSIASIDKEIIQLPSALEIAKFALANWQTLAQTNEDSEHEPS